MASASPAAARCTLALALALKLGPAMAQAPTGGEPGITVGQIVSSAPGLAEMGREMAAGAKACATWANARGGVRGLPIRLVQGDDGGDPSTLPARAREMVARHAVTALLTPMGRNGQEALLAWADKEKLAVVGPHGAGALTSQISSHPSTFVLRTHPSVEALRLSSQLQSLGVQRVAIVYSDDDMGREMLATFEEALASAGMAAGAVLPLREGAAPATARQLHVGAPQAVLLATNGRETQALLRALQGLQAEHGRIGAYLLSGSISAQELRALGPAAQGLVVSQVLPSPESGTAALARAYREAVQESASGALSYPGLEGCVAVLTLAQALRRGNEAPTRAGVLNALRTAGEIDLGGWSVNLADRRRPGSRFTDITLVGKDGRWVR